MMGLSNWLEGRDRLRGGVGHLGKRCECDRGAREFGEYHARIK